MIRSYGVKLIVKPKDAETAARILDAEFQVDDPYPVFEAEEKERREKREFFSKGGIGRDC